MIIIIVIVAVLVVAVATFFWLRGRKIKVIEPYVIAFVGSLGTGKTLLACNKAIALYKRNFKKFLKDGKKRKEYSEPPKFYSNIPIKFRFKGAYIYADTNIKNILLLKKRVSRGSVLFIDEMGLLIDKWQFKNEKVINEISNCFRLWRHYTKGGYIVMTDQVIDDIVKPIRDRINLINICLGVRKFLIFGCVQFSPISFTQQIDSYNADSLNKLVMRQFVIFRENYDSLAYSNLYSRYDFSDNKIVKSDDLKAKSIDKIIE